MAMIAHMAAACRVSRMPRLSQIRETRGRIDVRGEFVHAIGGDPVEVVRPLQLQLKERKIELKTKSLIALRSACGWASLAP
jgi:hypothetical protein